MSREDSVSNLRELIITECADLLQGVATRHLLLYRASIAHSSEIRHLDLKDTPPLHPRTNIGTLFPNGPGENEYIFIVNGMMLRCGLICVSFLNYTFLHSHKSYIASTVEPPYKNILI